MADIERHARGTEGAWVSAIATVSVLIALFAVGLYSFKSDEYTCLVSESNYKINAIKTEGKEALDAQASHCRAQLDSQRLACQAEVASLKEQLVSNDKARLERDKEYSECLKTQCALKEEVKQLKSEVTGIDAEKTRVSKEKEQLVKRCQDQGSEHKRQVLDYQNKLRQCENTRDVEAQGKPSSSWSIIIVTALIGIAIGGIGMLACTGK